MKTRPALAKPPTDRLKIDGDWQDAVRKALTKKPEAPAPKAKTRKK